MLFWTPAAAGGPAALPGGEKKVARVLSRCGSEILWSAAESSALKGYWMATSRRRSMLHRVSDVLITPDGVNPEPRTQGQSRFTSYSAAFILLPKITKGDAAMCDR